MAYLVISPLDTSEGSSWSPIRAPPTDSDGKQISCDPSNLEDCSLHLHSVTDPHNFGPIFSSTAPGLVMGVGSIGKQLSPYEECDTFLSTDAGLTWHMVRREAHMYEFGDTGSIILAVNDEQMTDTVDYSTDFGRTWYVDVVTFVYSTDHVRACQEVAGPRCQRTRQSTHHRQRRDVPKVHSPCPALAKRPKGGRRSLCCDISRFRWHAIPQVWGRRL